MERHTRHIERDGFTLIEALIAVAVLAVSVAAIAGALSAAAQQSSEMADAFTANSLARQILEEVASKSFEVDGATDPTDMPGFSAGASDRDLYDEISDFNGYWDSFVVEPDGTQTETSGNNTTARAMPAATGQQRAFLRWVEVSFQAPPLGPADATTDCAKVTVHVTSDRGYSMSVSQRFTRTFVR